MNNKLIVALDVPNLSEAEKLVKSLSSAVRIFKVGKELFTATGPKVVKMVHLHGGKVFLDLKFHDIPNTVAGACEAATRLGVFMLNVHSLGGRSMLSAAAIAVKKAAATQKISKPLLLGVTVLTSLSENDLKEVGIEKNLSQEVQDLAGLSQTAGLDGVVASPKEIQIIRERCGKDFLIVTPGVRPAWAAANDQKRVLTPAEAIKAGANYIVVGRPITQHKNPLQAAKLVLEEIGRT